MHSFKTYFHCHLLATSMDQQHMYLILLKVEQSAFTQASFSSLSDIHECSAGLEMAPSTLGKQIADCEIPHIWMVSFSWIQLICVTHGGKNGTSRSHLTVFSEDVAFASHSSHPIGVLVVLAMPVKSSKWWAIQLDIQCTADTVNYIEQLQIFGEIHEGSSLIILKIY